jgi:regulator-associated protein of mTOR
VDAFAVHNSAPIMACGSASQIVKFVDTKKNDLCSFKHRKGFMGNRIGPIHALAFHKHKMLLAAGGHESLVTIFGSRK